ncbi:MAG: hypothetical protein A2268_07765 [Candidatus Raymondbacteria bacterium RifOxyA12_full_50_37]|uniref:Soluble ligand binding domain-containing protein n=1 Tax=Candidatus Raymondbacteria bacterium RIFOXYD12_FULL_49_13 TaxID=1817890 RepID=A0A1F7F7L0_UNCRA|nr:MAG: hypothetical protein A2268_07765 [Candidatus Raymondbacteria bacterium RifOxyA12_full_50_37]OGJ88950.1 MAG: hypothetical protein A2350_12415 [Candidatus Raymondbacteria bacterium RifOxyB12_full_50_8]OGJ89602.1 MAG: hypothetical protein A2248_09485 [Candidatus Raymondbacteria bacterium RIFOXYA2_FULL_49_16]OGK02621.1 MAG: hypothetical protein A2519_11200 [Candidatus Raymondbacteria bacterium RIFOXYD12_FULL_49_13]OGP42858.1 MAG: hypothetical protein A2324_01900 [Candidatus Raymondbacteria 
MGKLMQKQNILFLLIIAFVLPLFARTIKTGDVLEITVPGNEALSQKVVVRDDGTVDYPLLMDRSVVDMSVQELMDKLTLAVAKVDPQNLVVVSLLSESKLKVQVLGQVMKPGMVLIDKGASLQEVFVSAAGFTPQADLRSIKLVRQSDGATTEEIVNLDRFLSDADLSILPDVQNGDVYIVPMAKTSRNVKVLGAVNQPGFYTAFPNANLFDLIQMAGGQQKDADLTKVRHITTFEGKKADTIIDLRSFWDELGDTEKIPRVQEGDMIIVYKKTLTWSQFMDYLRDFVTLVTVVLLVQAWTTN